MRTEKIKNAAKASGARLRIEKISRPSALMLSGAIDQINAAIAFSASSTQRNQDGPDGHGPTVKIRHQKWKKLKSVVPGRW